MFYMWGADIRVPTLKDKQTRGIHPCTIRVFGEMMVLVEVSHSMLFVRHSHI